MLQLWDYEDKSLLVVRDFNEDADTAARPRSSAGVNTRKTLHSRSLNRTAGNKDHVTLRPLCLAFEPDAAFLAIGFSSGIVKFISSTTLEDLSSFAPSTSPILALKLSDTANYLGAYDSSNHVILFGRPRDTAASLPDLKPFGTKRQTAFEYIGRVHAHSAPIVGIAFGSIDKTEVMLSVGRDRRVVEFDCDRSSPIEGVHCYGDNKGEAKSIRLELSALPSAVLWLPHEDDFSEDRYIVANDHFKFKEFNSGTSKCRKVTAAFGGYPAILLTLPRRRRPRGEGSQALSDMMASLASDRDRAADTVAVPPSESAASVAPVEEEDDDDMGEFLVYAADEHTLGIGALPLSGNPELVI